MDKPRKTAKRTTQQMNNDSYWAKKDIENITKWLVEAKKHNVNRVIIDQIVDAVYLKNK